MKFWGKIKREKKLLVTVYQVLFLNFCPILQNHFGLHENQALNLSYVF